ncbi:MAG: hypothetical protein M3N13_02765, partial [Candidatus Eremiobacteraeota bacterium]|nr:hypothetical protein [Candidatus Eremiobacteraeota bacterium]
LMYAGILAGGAIAGTGLGLFAKSAAPGDELALSISIAATFGNIALVFFSLGASVALSQDLGKPLWWISASPLRHRLYVWTLSTSWRSILVVAVASVAWSVTIANIRLAAISLPLAAVAVLFVRSSGLILYAIFPSKIDQRGPVAMLRVLACYVLMAPAVGLGIVTGLLARSAGAGIGAAVACAVVEAFGLIELSSLRIASSGTGTARAEVV